MIWTTSQNKNPILKTRVFAPPSFRHTDEPDLFGKRKKNNNYEIKIPWNLWNLDIAYFIREMKKMLYQSVHYTEVLHKVNKKITF